MGERTLLSVIAALLAGCLLLLAWIGLSLHSANRGGASGEQAHSADAAPDLDAKLRLLHKEHDAEVAELQAFLARLREEQRQRVYDSVDWSDPAWRPVDGE